MTISMTKTYPPLTHKQLDHLALHMMLARYTNWAQREILASAINDRVRAALVQFEGKRNTPAIQFAIQDAVQQELPFRGANPVGVLDTAR